METSWDNRRGLHRSSTKSIRRSRLKNVANRLQTAVARVEPLELRTLLSAAITFNPAVDYSTGVPTAPVAIVVADVNGDGIQDIVTLAYNGDVSVLAGKGDGTFERAQAVPDGLGNGANHQQNLAVAEVNGQATIFASNPKNALVSVLTDNAGVWQVRNVASNLSNLGSNINAMTVANLDGSQCLITADQGGAFSVTPVTQGSAHQGFIGFDFAATRSSPQVITDSKGNAIALTSLAVGNFVLGGDGADLVVVAANGTADTLAGFPGGFNDIRPSPIIGVTQAVGVYNAGPSNLIVLNEVEGSGSGKLGGGIGNGQLVPVSSSVTPLFGLGGGSPVTAFTNPGGTIATGIIGRVTVSDFNGDGIPDFAALDGSNHMNVFAGNGAGIYTHANPANIYTQSGRLGGALQPSSTNVAPKAVAIAAGDLRGDGKSDVILTYNAGGVLAGVVGVRLNQRTSTIPKITSVAGATAVFGSNFSFTVTTQGFPNPAITQSGGLPNGISFKNNGDGTASISGTPSFGAGGVYSLFITASNAAGNAIQTVTLTVNQAPTFTSASAATFTVGAPGTFAVATKGGAPSASLSVNSVTSVGTGNATSLAALGLSFTDNGDGTASLSGTPITGSGGLYQLTLIGAGGGGLSSAFGIKLTIQSRPVLAAVPTNAYFTVGNAGSVPFSATGFGAAAPALFLPSGTLPAGLSFTDNGDGTAQISGSPRVGAGGIYTLQVNARDSLGTATNGPLTLTLRVAEQPAIATANNAAFTVGASYQRFTFKTTGNTGFGNSTFNIASTQLQSQLPAGVTFTDNGDGTATLSGTPAPGTGGVYHLTVQSAFDSAGNPYSIAGLSPVSQNFTLTVNERPTFAPGAVVTNAVVSQLFSTYIVTTAGFGTPALRIALGNLPSGLTFVNNGDGTAAIFGTPAANSAGVYNLVIVATNGSGNGTLNYRLNVDQLPGQAINALTLTHGTPTSQAISLTGFPGPIGILNNYVSGLPAGLTLTVNSAGNKLLLNGTPTASGDFDVSYFLVNGDGLLATPIHLLLHVT